MPITREELQAAVPDLVGPQEVPGLSAPATVFRDEWGIPHIRTRTEADAHRALGFVHAQERLFQMELNRRRALGRAAEWLGAEAAEADVLARRLGMEAACRRDHAALGPDAREMLAHYVAGVNAFIGSGAPLAAEYALLGAEPEPWEPWHPIAVMRRLGLLMGSVWFKLWRALALPVVGAENVGRLRYDDGGVDWLCIPPGAEVRRVEMDLAALRPAVEALLAAMAPTETGAETGGGSNNWAVGPGRTETGRPILAGDPHRVFEIPGMYAQHHLACDSFDAVGLTVPGVPAFPHFMHNGHVACCVTHAFMDIHDLFLEQFDAAGRVRTPEGWAEPARRTEVVRVRGGEPRTVEVVETPNGPVVAGDPAGGAALSLRSVQFAETDGSFDCLPRMLRARTVAGLFEATRGWGLIDHNLVAADTAGGIGHLVRARVPKRPRANGWLPVPGWRAEHRWQGWFTHEEMPVVLDPPGGVIVTANNRVVADGPEPGDDYLCTDCHPPYRAARIAELVEQMAPFRVEDAARVHGDVSSPVGPLFQARLRTLPEPAGAAAAALRRAVLDWDGEMAAGSAGAVSYNALRRAMTAALVRRSGLGDVTAGAWGAVAPGVSPAGQLWWTLPTLLRNGDESLLGGGTWDQVMAEALDAASVPQGDWGRVHQPRFRHPLSGLDDAGLGGSALDPASCPVGGDGDTVMAVGLLPAVGPEATYGALCRYVFDVGNWENCRWAVFAGASGHPGSPHYGDQNVAWSRCEMVPMRYGWDGIAAAAGSRQVLRPGPG